MNANSYLQHTALYGCIFLLLVITGCGDGTGEPQQQTTPEVIQKVDDPLAQPYDAHFKNIQGDYTTANRIGDAIQGVIDATRSGANNFYFP